MVISRLIILAIIFWLAKMQRGDDKITHLQTVYKINKHHCDAILYYLMHVILPNV